MPELSGYHERQVEPLLVLYKVISRRDWDRLQDWLNACPGAHAERLYAGTYAICIPAGGAVEAK